MIESEKGRSFRLWWVFGAVLFPVALPMILAADEGQGDAAAPEKKTEGAKARRANRGALPRHLPRIKTIVDIEDKTCPCCRRALHRIGEDVSERLDVIPAQFRVLVTRRPKYACRAARWPRAIWFVGG